MRAKMAAFPAAYLNTNCRRHKCLLEVRIDHSEDRDGRKVGAQLIPTQCHVGGVVNEATCTDEWEIVMSGSGPVIVTT